MTKARGTGLTAADFDPAAIPFRAVSQRVHSAPLLDVPAAVREQLAMVLPVFTPGSGVAVTAGSRGVTNIGAIIRATCDAIRSVGGSPFVVPAMGSHGGATAAGQVELLASLGITEASVGAPIRASMEVVHLGVTPDGTPVVMDRLAHAAAGIVVVARIKQHTDFEGQWESGLAKMLAVGLGKEVGATHMHSLGANELVRHVPEAARVALERAPVVAGLAIVEDALGQTSIVEGLHPSDLLQREAELLLESKGHAARLPFDEADLLILDFLGKDISGTGMDTKVVGRMRIAGQPEPESPRVARLVALDITEASHGNANGLGLADVITQRLLDATDLEALRVNAAACGFWERAKVPVAFANDREAIATTLRSTGVPAREARVARVRDTLRLDRMWLSASLLAQATANTRDEGPAVARFDGAGNLLGHNTFPD